MTKPSPKLVLQAPASTPAETRSRGPRSLPGDLLRDASRRLGVIALLASALWILGPGLGHLAFRAGYPGDPRWRQLMTADWVALVMAPLSLALYFFTRRPDRDPRRMLDLGLWYMVFTGFAIGLTWHDDAFPELLRLDPILSWCGIVVLLFAALLPTPPRKMLLAALITVSMNPLGMLIAKWRGTWEFGSSANVLLMHYPDYLLAGVAAVISQAVTKLGQQVSRARELGSYQLGELLGRGGMGEVYRATHRMLARAAAIKLIRPETLGGVDAAARELAVKRFHREAEVAASLRSYHTVELYDFGVTEDETLYFVMELLEGMNLETLVRDHGPVPANRVVHILRQVCDSLEEAHARGLVHRDIKPANIHIGIIGLRHDVVKVLDFGLVKSVKAPVGESSLATGLGGTPGTPDYMAPEMTLGDAVDGRADLYALGCVAYFLLTGKLVFEASSVFHMIARHLNDTPVPPSQRSGTAVPPALGELVLQCLAKAPADRPQSAAGLERALAALSLPTWGEAEAAAWWAGRTAAT